MTGEFSTSLIDHDQDFEFDEIASCSINSISNHKIIELKGNFIPKGLPPLERLFSKDDTLLNPTMQYFEENVLSYNIGIVDEPKMIKISKTLSEEERNRYIKPLKEFVDIFSWSYEDLKTYNTNIRFH